MTRWMLTGLCLLLAACSTNSKDLERRDTLNRYEALVRWNQFDSIPDFIHPEFREDHPIRPVDLQRLHQFRVSQYTVKQVVSTGDIGFDRLVELRLYNQHTARERVVDYVESWRWDAERERWMLHSGLPDVTAGR